MWFFSCYEEYLWTVDSGFTKAKIFLENIRKLHKIHIKQPTVKFTLWVYTSQRFLGKVEKFLGKVENWIKFASKYQWQVCIMSNFNYLIASLMQLDFIESAPARILWNFNKLLHQFWSSDSAWKVSKYEGIFGSYFPAIGLNTEI